MEEKVEIKFAYRLKTIEILEEKLICSPQPPEQINEFHFSININHKFKKAEKSVFVIVEVLIKSSDEDIVYGSIKVAIIFELKNLNQFLDKKTQEVKFPLNFEQNLNAISVSTVRGIMFSHFKGTYLHLAILPVIHPNNFKLIKDKG